MDDEQMVCEVCHFAILEREKRVRIPRPQLDSDIPHSYFYLHNRYENDCFNRIKEKAALRKKAAEQEVGNNLLRGFRPVIPIASSAKKGGVD